MLSQQTTTSRVFPTVDFSKPKWGLDVRRCQCYIYSKLHGGCSAMSGQEDVQLRLVGKM